MPAYTFEALTAQGETRRGVLEADTAKAARNQLRSQALIPLQVAPVETQQNTAGGTARPLRRAVFNDTALTIWTRQIAGLVGSGLPLERALTALADEAQTERERNLVAALRAEV